MSILTPARVAFAIAISRGKSGAESIDIAFPDNNYSQGYKRLKAYRLIMDDDISHEIADRKAIMRQNADLGAQKIQHIIVNGKEHNALDASKFAIEQVDGRAKQTTEVTAKMVAVTYDLSGGQAPEMPEQIRQQLEG